MRLALAAGLTVAAAALAVVLSRPPLTVAGSNGVPAGLAVAFINHGEAGCQRGGTVPRGTEAIRVSLSANTGPTVGLKVLSGSTLVTEGEREAGWGIDETVTVPVKRVPRTIHGAFICTTVGPAAEPIQVNGASVRTPGGGRGIWLRMEYLRPGPRSWLSLASSVARRMGVDRAPGGAWVACLVVAVMIAVCVLASRLVLREAGIATRPMHTAGGPVGWLPGPAGRALRRVPRAAWTCALVASLSAACWSVVTPPFQVPDEPAHFAYAQYLAETGRLPNSNAYGFSQEEDAVLGDLHQPEVQWHPEVQTISSRPAQMRLREDLASPLNRSGPGGAGVAASQPPLYYALETIPYHLGSSGTLLDSLELMRLLSALMAGLTALFAFLFVRECLPGIPWAWTVGGLGAALAPLLGFTSGALTPDAMLCAVSAAIFYCLARAFRRGLTRGPAVAIGALAAVGFLTKLNFVGLAPGVMLGLVVLAFRGVRDGPDALSLDPPIPGSPRHRTAHRQAPSPSPRGVTLRVLRRCALARLSAPDAQPGLGGSRPRSRHAFAPMAVAMAIAVSPVCVYVLGNLLEHRRLLGLVSGAIHDARKESILGAIAYVWQFYLPRLPGMVNCFPGLSTIRQLWFDRAVGLYGWLDTAFPVWVFKLALVPAGVTAILGLRTLLARRATLRARLPEFLVYLAMSAGLMALIGADSRLNRLVEGTVYAQPRYLLPLLPLAAAALALAARGAGRRWGPAAGALIVVLFLAHDIFSQLLVVARYYG